MAEDILRNLLGDDAGEKLRALFGSGGSAGEGEAAEDTKAIQVQGNDYTDNIRGLINELSRPNDPRSQLLLSLRPYMSEGRKRSIDNAVKLLNISKLSGMFK